MARRQLSMNKRTWIVKQMYRLEYPINMQKLWSKEINNNPKDRKTITSLIKKFEQTGSVFNIDSPLKTSVCY
jgi:hypothetical protein